MTHPALRFRAYYPGIERSWAASGRECQARYARVVDGRLYSPAQLRAALGLSKDQLQRRFRRLAEQGIGQPTMDQLRCSIDGTKRSGGDVDPGTVPRKTKQGYIGPFRITEEQGA